MAIEVTKGSGKSGEIHLRQGNALSCPSRAQKPVMRRSRNCLVGAKVEVREREKPGSTNRTIGPDWPSLLVETFSPD